MKFKYVLLVLALLATVAIIGCVGPVEAACPVDATDCQECLDTPVYDTEITIYGKVNLLGDVSDPYFLLVSGGKEIRVWYDGMIEDDGTQRPAVSVEGIENGDNAYVIGELKREGTHTVLNDFWAKSIVEY